MKSILRRLKSMLRSVGWEIRRADVHGLPVLWESAVDGEAFRFWIANQHTYSWWAKPSVEMDAELRFLKEVTFPGSTVLEVGAHHGFHTIQLSRWAGATGSVHAFELNAANALVLSANAGANRLPNVHVIHSAVGASAGELATEGERVVAGSGGQRALTLDGYCDENGIDGVDVLKIDVEGYEGQVLSGARRLLQSTPNISLELHLDDLSLYGETPESALRWIDFANYSVAYMCRPDWETLHPFRDVASLPDRGVVNLFFKRQT